MTKYLNAPVLFPLPDPPTMATDVPASISSDKLFKTGVSGWLGYANVRFSIRIDRGDECSSWARLSLYSTLSSVVTFIVGDFEFQFSAGRRGSSLPILLSLSFPSTSFVRSMTRSDAATARERSAYIPFQMYQIRCFHVQRKQIKRFFKKKNRDMKR